jgi:hypothetical protein
VRALGLAVAVSSRRPTVRAVLLADPFDASLMPTLADVALRDAFEFTTTETHWAGICDQFAQDVSARVSSLQPDIVVVRQADFTQNGRVGDGPRLRLVVEGAITAAAIKHIPNTVLRRGKGCADVYPGKSKDKMDADGRSLVDKAARAEAAGAALSGLFGNRT